MTAQAGEVLFYKGEHHTLFSNPLDSYLARLEVRPNFDFKSTGCWRGYIGSWEFADDLLHLTEIRATIKGEPFQLNDLFPGSKGKVCGADWVTDLFHVPQGECDQYVHAGYGSTYERDLFLAVWQGRLALVEVVDNRAKQRLSSEATSQVENIFGAEEAAFIWAIRTNPNERINRLAYADWLEERNDPRSQLVHLEDERRYVAPPKSAAEWFNRPDTKLRLQNWLWTKLLDYPLPRGEYDGHEIVSLEWLQRLAEMQKR